MQDVMVTGRMSAEKKAAANAVLEKSGMNASQVINAVWDKIIETKDTDFISSSEPTRADWKAAAKLIDSISSPVPIHTRFDNMTRGEIKLERAKSRGWI